MSNAEEVNQQLRAAQTRFAKMGSHTEVVYKAEHEYSSRMSRVAELIEEASAIMGGIARDSTLALRDMHAGVTAAGEGNTILAQTLRGASSAALLAQAEKLGRDAQELLVLFDAADTGAREMQRECDAFVSDAQGRAQVFHQLGERTHGLQARALGIVSDIPSHFI